VRSKLCSVVSVAVTLNTVPAPVPPHEVVPWKFPSVACTSADIGPAPSVQFGCEQKLYTVVSVPLGVILKTEPQPPRSTQLDPPRRSCPVEAAITSLHKMSHYPARE
jgi:hypothetical protein